MCCRVSFSLHRKDWWVFLLRRFFMTWSRWLWWKGGACWTTWLAWLVCWRARGKEISCFYSEAAWKDVISARVSVWVEIRLCVFSVNCVLVCKNMFAKWDHSRERGRESVSSNQGMCKVCKLQFTCRQSGACALLKGRNLTFALPDSSQSDPASPGSAHITGPRSVNQCMWLPNIQLPFKGPILGKINFISVF